MSSKEKIIVCVFFVVLFFIFTCNDIIIHVRMSCMFCVHVYTVYIIHVYVIFLYLCWNRLGYLFVLLVPLALLCNIRNLNNLAYGRLVH